MTTDNQAGSGNAISNQEELAAALQKELGEAAGYLDLKYREWCCQQPDEVDFDLSFHVNTQTYRAYTPVIPITPI